MPDWIAGIGTGRCGTKSLAELLGVPHENDVPQPFGRIERVQEREYETLLEHVDETDGGVAYWLGWVAERLLEDRDVRVVAMMRPVQAFQSSFLEVLGSEIVRKKERRSSRERKFPSHPCLGRVEAIRRYWADYNSMILQLKAGHPRDVLLASTGQLSTEAGRQQIVQHCYA